jgi:hypothetical protein
VHARLLNGNGGLTRERYWRHRHSGLLVATALTRARQARLPSP